MSAKLLSVIPQAKSDNDVKS